MRKRKKTDNKRKIEKVVVTNFLQLKTIMQPYMSSEGISEDISLETEMEWKDEDGNKFKSKITADSRQLNPKQVLLEGFEIIKKRKELAERASSEVEDEDEELLPEKIKWGLFDIDSQRFSIDNFIEQRLSGKRKGLRITWDIEEGKFSYDPFRNKLFKIGEE